MTDHTTSKPETFAFQAEIQQLLNILVHSLYTEREIFLREIISNASDALNRVQFEMLTSADVLDPEAELSVRISGDPEANTLTITDTGIGMNREELIENLGTIAQSGAASFLKRLREQPDQSPSASNMIGQFGVGFYSVFMVADKVTVTSRSYRPHDAAWTWTSDGSTTYAIEQAEQATRGTTITIHLKEDAHEFTETYRLRSIIKKHSDYIAFPIYLGNEDQPVNQQQAIWRKAARDVQADEYTAFYKQLTLDYREPLVHLHIQADAPVQFYSILFIPSQADRGLFSLRSDFGLKLYTRKVLIQEYNKDFLPHYLRFVDGVVDSEDLPLNVARESIQATRMIKRIGQSIRGKILAELEDIAESDADRYQAFWKEFGAFIKEGIATEPEDAERLAKLLRFHSSLSDGETPTVTLEDYLARMKPDQQHIYYILVDDLKSARLSPHLDTFRAHDLEVLYLTDTVDSFMLMNLPDYQGKSLRNVDDAGLELPAIEDAPSDETPLAEDDFEAVRQRFAAILGDRVVEVRESKVLRDHPVRLATPEGQLDRNVQRVYKMLDKEVEAPRRILELNRRHDLIRNLAGWIGASPDAPVIAQVIEQLYENALLLDGIHPNPAQMVSRIQSLMEAATRRSD